MRDVLEIIDSHLNKLINSTPSRDLKITLNDLIESLKDYDYPMEELVDIISVGIMLDYLLSADERIASHEKFIKKGFEIISDILGDRLYVKIEPELISLEDEFYRNIAPSPKQFDNMLTEEIKKLVIKQFSD
ncbi:hypothetical protein SAMN02910315_00620 [Methanobrevibacter millerae]|uniref:Uncharacterized protein n=1 Tax=Methanobrevibacter millerae TaxID=230361 RepID=A0A1G5VIZ2_9EURY|nr:hypothetical protein SAMN02910315_00620 [Methanobrevibacter millerae]